MNGIYWLLVSLPLGATTFGLYVLTLGMIFILRDTKEGLFYNTSYSAMIGDGALLAVIVSAIGILKQGGRPPEWLAPDTQSVLAVIGVFLGLAWYLRDNPKCPGDKYHHLVIAPLFFFLWFTMVPVIIKNGTWWDNALAVCCVVIWAVLVAYDAATGRLDQRRYYDLGTFLNKFKELQK